MAVSTEVNEPFIESTIPEAKRLEELKLYDRYFQDLSSWCKPDIAIGCPPRRSSRKDELVLMQSGHPVSSYRFPDGEEIVTAEVVALATEKAALQLNIGMGRPPAHAIGGKRKVFVVCSTVKPDPHGEDTPGEGRLILFSLDYSVLQSEEVENKAEKAEKADMEDKGDAMII